MEFHEDLRYDYPLRKGSVVIDLGCYHGDFALRVASQYDCHVIGFEPVFYHEAQTVAGGRFRVFPFAVGGNAREDSLSVFKDQTTLYPHDFHSKTAASERPITVLPFAPVMALLGVDRVDLLKVNIEGEEYGLLRHLIGWGWLARIDYLQVQFHNFVEGAEQERDRLMGIISRTHDIQWDFPWIWTSWRKKVAI